MKGVDAWAWPFRKNSHAQQAHCGLQRNSVPALDGWLDDPFPFPCAPIDFSFLYQAFAFERRTNEPRPAGPLRSLSHTEAKAWRRKKDCSKRLERHGARAARRRKGTPEEGTDTPTLPLGLSHTRSELCRGQSLINKVFRDAF